MVIHMQLLCKSDQESSADTLQHGRPREHMLQRLVTRGLVLQGPLLWDVPSLILHTHTQLSTPLPSLSPLLTPSSACLHPEPDPPHTGSSHTPPLA